MHSVATVRFHSCLTRRILPKVLSSFQSYAFLFKIVFLLKKLLLFCLMFFNCSVFANCLY